MCKDNKIKERLKNNHSPKLIIMLYYDFTHLNWYSKSGVAILSVIR